MADYIRFSDASEATDAQMVDAALIGVSIIDSNSTSGYASRRSPLSKVANYILNKYSSLSLGGSTRTVKSAIDSINNKVTFQNMSFTASSASSIEAGETGTIDIAVTLSGYSPLGIVGIDIKDEGLGLVSARIVSSTTARIVVVNNTESSISVSPTIDVLYQHN